MPNITTSIPQKEWNLAIEKHIRWNEALICGIKHLSRLNLPMGAGETIIKESEKAKIEKLKAANSIMQDKILELDALLEKKDVV